MIMAYCFDELRYQKVNAAVHGDNLPSMELQLKLGFQLEGTQRRMVYTQGRYVDCTGTA